MKTDSAVNSVVPVTGHWFIGAPRRDVYAIISDFEAMPRNFPRVAREMKIVKRDGTHLSVEALSASFGRFFPSARILIAVDVLPEEGYRCQTHNLTFNTTGQEELRLIDENGGTRIDYTYYVTVRSKFFKPIYAWLVRTLALPFWKRSFVDRLEELTSPRMEPERGGNVPSGGAR
jgi:hypothetical protein